MRNKLSQQEIATPPNQDCNKSTQPISKKTSWKKTTRKLTYIATLVALSLLLKILGNQLALLFPPFFKPSLVYIAWFLSAIILGPIHASAVTLVTEVLGMFLVPSNLGIIPFVVVANCISPLIVGCCFKYLPLSKAVNLFIGATISILVCTLGLNTLALAITFKINYFAYLLTRLPQALVVYANTLIVLLMLPTIKKLKLI